MGPHDNRTMVRGCSCQAWSFRTTVIAGRACMGGSPRGETLMTDAICYRDAYARSVTAVVQSVEPGADPGAAGAAAGTSPAGPAVPGGVATGPLVVLDRTVL